MNSPRVWTRLLLTLAMVSFAPVLQPATSVVDIALGEGFTGTIDGPGDTVEARFFVAEGAAVRVVVQAAQGSTLQPTVSIKDPDDIELENGTTRRIGWLPVANLYHYFTAPETGRYSVEIGAESGSGDFSAHVSGSSSEVPLTSVSGTVTDILTDAAIEGAEVLVNDTLFDTTDENGDYSGELLPGSYLVTFAADEYETLNRSLEAADTAVVLNVSLVPQEPVTVEADVSGDEVPGGLLTATVEITAPPGTIIDSIVWTQERGVDAGITGADTETATVTLAETIDYKDELIHVLSEPPVGEDQLPPNVPLPPGEFPGGLQNRFQVVGINPLALEEAALVVLKVEVTTNLGTVHDEVEIHAEVPWKVATGLRNVPQGTPVLLQGKEQGSYDWVMTPPPGSSAVLIDGTTRNPYFTPDFPGLYEIEVPVESGGDRGLASTIQLEVYAGAWRGVIVDQDMDGRPVGDRACMTCHNGDDAPDKFTDWVQTGHAEIFTDNLNTSTHYGGNCFPCHTVGYDPEVDSGGIDDASDYEDFLDAGLINNPGDNWTTVLEEFPDTAQLANIQCENCHGPQLTPGAHGFAGPPNTPRVDISSDVCATCHGEPLRHARFQQWQLSAHANYELAIDESQSGSCSRCHTGNGFLTWLPILLDDDPDTDPTDDIFFCDGDTGTCVGGANDGEACDDDDECPPEWTEDETHPQTCATCHDPHAAGNVSGSDPNATVRISGDTPPLIAGFQATDVGRGAICMTCHNSRRGLRNDDTFDDFSTSEKARAPHGSSQTDVLMGQNAYLVEVGNRGGHSLNEDTCVDCHMEATPPPDVLSYNQGGTNHTFFADRFICSECHSPHMTADDVQSDVQFLLDQVQDLIEDGQLALIGELTGAGYTIHLNPRNGFPDGDATIEDVNQVAAIEFGEARGRQAITVSMEGETFGPYRVTDVDVRDAGEDIGTLYDFAADALIKSGWNWNLINNDGSVGVHHPFFASGALIAARDALVRASGATAPTQLKSGSQDSKRRVLPGRRLLRSGVEPDHGRR